MKAFLQQPVKIRDGCDSVGDTPAGFAVAIGARRRLPPAAQRRRNRCRDRLTFRSGVEHRSGALAALLPVADVDAGGVERRRFVDSARGIADHDVGLVHQADVAKLPQGGDRDGVRPACHECLDALVQGAAFRVGVGEREEQTEPRIERRIS